MALEASDVMRMVQLVAMVLTVAAQTVIGLAADPASAARFDGSRALVLAPDLVWQEWDSAIYGALEERGFAVTYRHEVGQSPQAEKFDLVAINGERRLSEAEQRVLSDFLRSGGAIYVSWDQPYAWGRGAGPGAPELLRAAGAAKGATALRVRQVTIAQGVASAGLPQAGSALKKDVGCFRAPEEGWTAVALEAAEGAKVIMAAQDGAALGVLAEPKSGRIAALGLPLEQEKYLQAPELAAGALDNVLKWLLAGRPEGERAPLEFVTVAVPARADVTGVFVDGQPVADPVVRQVGSLKTVQLETKRWAKGEIREIRVAYRTLTPGRNVEAMVHMPWGTLRGAADSPAVLAEYLASMGATVCQPLLRSANGRAWYKGMPDDSPDEKLVTNYKGDFLADLIRECHDRGIKVVAGLYLDNDTPVRRYPEVKRLNRQGEAVKDNSGRFAACFNNPKGREHNLATIEDLLARYKVDGLILDDNYWLDYSDTYTCYCPYCKEAFGRWCEAKGVAYADPAATQDGKAAELWWAHKREATRALATRVREIAASHGVPAGAGGWASSGMGMMHLAGPFDFLGEMQYSSPPRAMRGPLSVAGAHRLICLLWEPNVSGEQLEREVREAVHAGCQTVGFWTGTIAQTYKAPAEKFDAMRRAFASVEMEWRRFYARNVLRGDGRFAVVQGRADADELRLRVVHGERARVQKTLEAVDLSALP